MRYARCHSVAAVAAALATVSNGHMIMANPKPFGGPDLDNSPLTSSNYPCKLKGDPATFYKADGLDNTMAVGESQTLSFKGSAVHGGGSCQLAITQDLQPSVSTSWQVIESIEGGCPSKSGQGADTYDWKIPDGVAPGKYVFAWTWVSKLAGQPEYYMNCAPITVTGGQSKRSDNETLEILPRDSQFPELCVVNLADINSCKTEPGTDPEYPNPGPNVVRPGTNNKFAKIQGDNCVPKGATSSGSSGNNKSDAGGSDSGNESSSPSVTSSSSVSSSTSSASVGSSLPGFFITSVTQGESSSSSSSMSPASTPSSSVPAVASSAAPAGSSSPANSSSSVPVSGLTGPCTAEGMFNCIGGTSYQQCASGSWSVVMQMPPTTKCAEGQTMTLWGRDEMPPRKIGRRGH
ncbi:lytic polysaccharide monooxygenase [Hypoxylon sp. FL1857]|nr:lytic polysaccharide monooxygenase [Hypoxylon sp. FL1857]